MEKARWGVRGWSWERGAVFQRPILFCFTVCVAV